MPNAPLTLARVAKAQGLSLAKVLDLPLVIPPASLEAELGIFPIPLEAARRRLLSLHKIYNNRLDTITPKLMSLTQNPHVKGSTELDKMSDLLKTITLRVTLPVFLQVPYTQAKEVLYAAMGRVCQTAWASQSAQGTSTQRFHGLTKPRWAGASAGQVQHIHGQALFSHACRGPSRPADRGGL